MIGTNVFVGTNNVKRNSKTFLLDQSFASGATAAYSLRRLKISATKAVRVREDSGNTETDIGFSGGTLDETALLNHCGSNNGFVTKWYDQSGNANDASNSTASEQPQIVNSGNLVKENNEVALDFDGSDDFLNGGAVTFNQPNTIFCVFKFDTSSTSGSVYDSESGRQMLDVSSGDWRLFAGTSLIGSSADKDEYISTALFNGASSELFLNGSSEMSGDVGTSDMLDIIIGSNTAQIDPFDGKMKELIIYEDNKISDREKIENNVNGYYSIF